MTSFVIDNMPMCGAPLNTSKEKRSENVGLALSGGINIAAAAGAAIMRGFQQQTVTINDEERPAMEAFTYVSGLSGGIIPTILYVYAQTGTTNQLLDAEYNINPSQITKIALNRKNKNCIQHNLNNSQLKRLLPRVIFHGLRGDIQSAWTSGMYAATLQPFGIKRNQFFGPKTAKNEANTIVPRDDVRAEPLLNFVMAGQRGSAGEEFAEAFIKTKKKDSKELTGKFNSPQDITRLLEKVDNKTFIPYTASPTEVGTHYCVPMKLNSGEIIEDISCYHKPSEWGSKKNRFSLELALGMGSNIATLQGLGKGAQSTAEFNVASQARKFMIGKKERTLIFTDGGLVDSLGVPALAQKKMRHIIASVCGHGPVRKYARHYEETKDGDLEGWLMKSHTIALVDIASYFGFFTGPEEGYILNHIFADGKKHLTKLRADLDALYLAGKPLITTMQDLEVIDNPYWGTKAGEKVDLTIIYWSAPKSFTSQVPRESVPPPQGQKETIDATGSFTNEDFKEFPNLDGFANFHTHTKTYAAIKYGSLSKAQINMMSYLGSWMVKEAWEGLYIDGKQVFGGFKDILDTEFEC